MIRIKSEEEIEILRENAILVSKTLAEVGRHVAPGVTTMQLDKIAETFIRDNGAEPGFLGYGGFPYTLCVSVNDVVVHGFPSDYKLKEGDIVSVDCGTVYKGYYGDSAYTFPVGEVDEETARLLKVTKESLYLGIHQGVPLSRYRESGRRQQDRGHRTCSPVLHREFRILGCPRDGRARNRQGYARASRGSKLRQGGHRQEALKRYDYLYRADDQCRRQVNLPPRERMGCQHL